MKTFFEKELEKIINFTEEADFTTYIGNSAYIQITEENRVRVDFREMGTMNRYEAIQFTVINKEKGVLDILILKFKDIWFDKASYISVSYETDWYMHQPETKDYLKLSEALQNYVNLWN